MISYKDAQTLVGPKPEVLPKKIEYIAYKGMHFEKFDTYSKAKAYSKLVETCVVNAEEIKASQQAVKDWEHAVFQYWYYCLQQEFHYLPIDIFELCYDQAYDRGHSAGYDEVSNYMIDIVDFAGKIVDAVKRD